MIGRCTHVVDCRATGGMGKGGGLAQRGTFAECGAEVLAVAICYDSKLKEHRCKIESI